MVKKAKKKIKKLQSDSYKYAIYQPLQTVDVPLPSGKKIRVNPTDTLLMPEVYQFPKKKIGTLSQYLTNIETVKHTPDKFNKKNILVIRYGGIGDIITSLYGIAEFKKKYPTCEIIYMCSDSYADILKCFPHLISYVANPIENASILKNIHYLAYLEDLIESNHNELIHKVFAKPFKTDHLITKETTTKLINLNKANENSNNRNGIGIQYVTSAPNRNYNIERIIELINKLIDLYPDKKIYLLGRPDEFLYVNYIQARVSKPDVLIPNGCGFPVYELPELVNLISKLELVIAPDSSMVHIAAVCNTPIIGLFGPINPNTRMSIYHNAVAIRYTADCVPCNKHFPFNFCKFTSGLPICVNSITPDDVIEVIKSRGFCK